MAFKEQIMAEISILSWNVGGGKFLLLPAEERAKFKNNLNNSLKRIIEDKNPQFVLLQEIVRSGSSSALEDLIAVPNNYYFKPSIALDTERQTYREKWETFCEKGGWSRSSYLGLGTGILWRKDQNHCAIWDFDNFRIGPDIHAEEVHLDTGLYTGDRDTEPRLAVVVHFVLLEDRSPLDVFVVNLHLTTLKYEREGILERDDLGSRIRLAQIDIVLNGIVSRYNEWRKRKDKTKPSAVWILAGDFNCTPESPEIVKIKRMNFLDIIPSKGTGTKAKGFQASEPKIILDYIFAGPKYIAFDPDFVDKGIKNNSVLHHVSVSDHFPLFGKLKFSIS
jgi:endonuclease/exonuclease/phosphatase family metal-dependent hydrolase